MRAHLYLASMTCFRQVSNGASDSISIKVRANHINGTVSESVYPEGGGGEEHRGRAWRFRDNDNDEFKIRRFDLVLYDETMTAGTNSKAIITVRDEDSNADTRGEFDIKLTCDANGIFANCTAGQRATIVDVGNHDYPSWGAIWGFTLRCMKDNGIDWHYEAVFRLVNTAS